MVNQITLDRLKKYRSIWIPSEHSCGYNTCYLDWEYETVKQEQEYIDWCNSVEEYVKSLKVFFLDRKDAASGENGWTLVDEFTVGENAVVSLCVNNTEHENEYLRQMDGKMVKLIYQEEATGLFITDCFVEELMEECSDYTHYGFMKVFHTDIRHIDSK